MKCTSSFVKNKIFIKIEGVRFLERPLFDENTVYFFYFQKCESMFQVI